MRFLIVLPILAGCRTAAQPLPPDGWFPLADGTRWVYEVRNGERVERHDMKATGGDVRTLEGAEVPYRFVYGRPPWADHDITKSIYAVPEAGAREFYLDASAWSLWHDPPVALLPPRPAVGAAWAWEGRFEYEAGERDASAAMTVEALEEIEVPAGRFSALRVRSTYDDGVVVVRWFARGVGCVRLDVEGGSRPRGMKLVEYALP